jgi:hypothetical protein
MVKMGAVWDRTAEFLTDNLGTVLPIALLAFFVPASIEGSLSTLDADPNSTLALILGLMAVAFAILSMWGSLTITAMALDTDPHQAGTVARNRLLLALAVWVSLFLVLAILASPLFLIFGTTFGGVSNGAVVLELPASVGAAAALYGVALLGLSLWLGARLAVIMPVIVAERRMFGAIRRSWQLTRGQTLSIVGVLVLWAFVMIVAIWATQTVFGSVFQLIAGPSDGPSLSGVLTSVMVAAVRTAFTVLAPAFATKLYLALAAEREAAQPA